MIETATILWETRDDLRLSHTALPRSGIWGFPAAPTAASTHIGIVGELVPTANSIRSARTTATRAEVRSVQRCGATDRLRETDRRAQGSLGAWTRSNRARRRRRRYRQERDRRHSRATKFSGAADFG